MSAINSTIIICSGSSIDTKHLVATVRKAGDKKAVIDLERKGQIEYVIEGDLLQRNYMVKLSNTQVAQVHISMSYCFRCIVSFLHHCMLLVLHL